MVWPPTSSGARPDVADATGTRARRAHGTGTRGGRSGERGEGAVSRSGQSTVSVAGVRVRRAAEWAGTTSVARTRPWRTGQREEEGTALTSVGEQRGRRGSLEPSRWRRGSDGGAAPGDEVLGQQRVAALGAARRPDRVERGVEEGAAGTRQGGGVWRRRGRRPVREVRRGELRARGGVGRPPPLDPDPIGGRGRGRYFRGEWCRWRSGSHRVGE